MSDRVYIFDTTLRDGEQSPGATMNLDEKMQIAQILEEMRVDIIEAGFPIASNGDFDAVSEISKNIKNSTIAGLARAKLADIEEDNFELDSSICVTVSLFFPETNLPVEEKEYYFNSVAIREMADQIGDEEEYQDDDIRIAMAEE